MQADATRAAASKPIHTPMPNRFASAYAVPIESDTRMNVNSASTYAPVQMQIPATIRHHPEPTRDQDLVNVIAENTATKNSGPTPSTKSMGKIGGHNLAAEAVASPAIKPADKNTNVVKGFLAGAFSIISPGILLPILAVPETLWKLGKSMIINV